MNYILLLEQQAQIGMSAFLIVTVSALDNISNGSKRLFIQTQSALVYFTHSTI